MMDHNATRRQSRQTMTNNDGQWQTTRCIQRKSRHRPSHDHPHLKLMHGSSPVTSNTTDQHNTKTTTTMMLSRPWPRRMIVTRSQPQCEDDHNGQPTTMHVSPDITCVMTNHIWISSFFQYQLNEFYLRQQILRGSVPWWHLVGLVLFRTTSTLLAQHNPLFHCGHPSSCRYFCILYAFVNQFHCDWYTNPRTIFCTKKWLKCHPNRTNHSLTTM